MIEASEEICILFATTLAIVAAEQRDGSNAMGNRKNPNHRTNHAGAASVSESVGPPPIEMQFQGKGIRSVIIDRKLWFVATDVCSALDLADTTTTLRPLHKSEKTKCKVATAGGSQELNVVDESGLYALAFISRKPNAVAFRRWVTNEVLPSLRRLASGEPQDTISGRTYVSFDRPGRYLTDISADGRVYTGEQPVERYVEDAHAAGVDALALSVCVLGTLWRQHQVHDALAIFNRTSHIKHQIAAAMRQAEELARHVMRLDKNPIEPETDPPSQGNLRVVS